jgi:hypothetical protein
VYRLHGPAGQGIYTSRGGYVTIEQWWISVQRIKLKELGEKVAALSVCPRITWSPGTELEAWR